MKWSDLLAVVFGDAEFDKIPTRALSFALLIFALVCAWLPHKQSYYWLWDGWVSFTPDFVSGALALAVITPLYARRIVPYPGHSVNSVLFLVVNLALTATFVQIILGKGSGLSTVPALIVISGAVVLSWLGMRSVASLAWLALLAFGTISSVLSNYSWGLAGFGFIISGFCGILLQTELNPGQLMAELAAEYALKSKAIALTASTAAGEDQAVPQEQRR
jgi:hypothetical protein